MSYKIVKINFRPTHCIILYFRLPKKWTVKLGCLNLNLFLLDEVLHFAFYEFKCISWVVQMG